MSTTAPVGPQLGATVAGGASPAAGVVPPGRRAVGVALIVVGALVGAGVLLGVVWSLVAPTVPCTVVEGDCPYNFEAGRFFVAEGLYGAIAFGCGVLAAIVVRHWVRVIGWPVLVALAVGGLLASVVAWRVGVWLGPDDPNSASLPVGDLAELPLRLRSSGLLLACPIGSLLVALWIALSGEDLDDRDPAGRRPGPDPALAANR